MKTLLLMRHSIPDRTCAPGTESGLSAEGIQRAQQIFQTEPFRRVSRVWSSPSLRAVQTAQLLGLPAIQDTRLAERRTGDTTGQDFSFWARQYTDPDFKNPDGESFREVRTRMSACLAEILVALPDGETALVVSHAAAICSYLQQFCTVEVTDAQKKMRRITFEGKVLLEGKMKEGWGIEMEINKNRQRFYTLTVTGGDGGILPRAKQQPTGLIAYGLRAAALFSSSPS